MKEILKYQDIDMLLKKVESDIVNSEERKNASKMQQYLKDCQVKLQELNQKCSTVVKKYEQLKVVYSDMVEKSQIISKSVESANEKKLESLQEASNAIVSNLKKLEKEIQILSKQLETLAADFESIMKSARTAKKNLDIYKDAYNNLKTAKDPEVKSLQKELKAQEKNVDKSLLAKYLSKNNDKNLPVFVPEIKGRCGGCRVEIAGRTLEKLKNTKYIECENCGRIIYSE